MRAALALGASLALNAAGAWLAARAGALAHRRRDLSLDDDELARIAGTDGAERVEGVEEGEETWLDSREFRFATFLNQTRREIGDAWYPRVRAAVRGRDPEGSAFFYRERTVVLAVTLGARGEVRALSVLRSSDVDFVDAITLASVREAQPFANPPRAMFEGGGKRSASPSRSPSTRPSAGARCAGARRCGAEGAQVAAEGRLHGVRPLAAPRGGGLPPIPGRALAPGPDLPTTGGQETGGAPVNILVG